MSAEPTRMLLHERTIVVRGYVRSDGLYDIESELTDRKAHPFSNGDARGVVGADTPVHHMKLNITVNEDLLISQCDAGIAASPYGSCNDISPRFALLKGLYIGSGWRRKVEELVGGILGCVHLRELVSTVATGAVQTLVPLRFSARSGGKVPAQVDMCHTYRRDGEVAKCRWPSLSDAKADPGR
jgi:hypothetical protein